MIFSSIHFVVFFIILLLCLLRIKESINKKYVLLTANVFFYAYWDVRFVPILFLLAIVNFYGGKYIHKYGAEDIKRTRIMSFCVTINLFVLGYFKYTNFFIENITEIISKVGLNISTLNILLPLGISFFIFEFISYLVDIYRKNILPENNILDFFEFAFFFPRIASGPIIRAADFLPQIQKDININKNNFYYGFQIFLMGLFKKVVIADRLAPCADIVFLSPQVFDSTTIWVGVIAYTIQIYCDFSGYSDMAIGIAKILGIDLPVNFNMPYISKNVTEFWKRWHISLSSWLRDYLYISLGGNRNGGRLRTYSNIMITMLIGGLWHGANWTFVIWGGLHGLALVVHKNFSEWYTKQGFKISNYIATPLSIALTFIFVSTCWVFFRSSTFNTAFIIINKMYIPSSGVHWVFSPLIFFVLPIVIIATVLKMWNKEAEYIILDLNKLLPICLLVFTIFTIFFMSEKRFSPFIYFQF